MDITDRETIYAIVRKLTEKNVLELDFLLLNGFSFEHGNDNINMYPNIRFMKELCIVYGNQALFHLGEGLKKIWLFDLYAEFFGRTVDEESGSIREHRSLVNYARQLDEAAYNINMHLDINREVGFPIQETHPPF